MESIEEEDEQQMIRENLRQYGVVVHPPAFHNSSVEMKKSEEYVMFHEGPKEEFI
eukprot:CAMPEP_0202980568 /NCGR_PEP_ID=MMETSP1396-20130829/86470_1 /ASSEMBLY_ACC=CAM_ASM_000872 /TAXON_ID= /ORGANISM="Pseudokeronopsis sp., Strain Brazil" /LENGTH=54 /DNA_ID=CAMNT_0049720631 /DNA_START=309 /DNA_END=473 /DNA_ORIENTATION=+